MASEVRLAVVAQRPDTTPEAAIESLPDELCRKFGFCLPPESKMALVASPPDSVHAFTDAVIAGDGLDPATYDPDIRRQMVRLVEDEAGRIL